jgi:uncharacterized protein
MAIAQPAAPGVYLIEPPPAVPHVVQAATTSVAAFPGVYPSGPVGEAVLVGSWDDFVSQYGGLSEDSSMAALAVWQFFQNGGTSAYIVRLDSGNMTRASAKIGGIVLTALSAGAALNGTSVTLRPSSDLGATASAVDLVATAVDNTPLETIKGLPSTPAGLAKGINSGSSYFSAEVDPSGGTPYTPPPVAPAAFTKGSASVGGVTLKTPAQWYSDVDVQFETPESGLSGVLDLLVAEKPNPNDPTAKPVPLERLFDLRTDSAADMAQDLGASAYFTAGPTKNWTKPPAAGDTVAISSKGIGSIANAITITAVDTPPWQQELAAQILGATSNGRSLELVLVNSTAAGPGRVEWLQGLPTVPPTGEHVRKGEETVPAEDSDVVDEAAEAGSEETTESAGSKKSAEATEATKSVQAPSDALATAISDSSAFVMATADDSPPYQFAPSATLAHGNDGSWDATALKDALLAQFGAAPAPPVPIPALDQIAPNVFNLMCVPDAIWLEEADQISVLQDAQMYCQKHQAFLIVDTPAPTEATPTSPMFGTPSFTVPPLGNDVARQAFLQTDWKTDLFSAEWFCGAAYYPWVTIPNPTPAPGGQPMPVPPSGTIAGVYAATDAARNVWKAPAGTTATLSGVLELIDKTMSDQVNADLNGQGINCLRNFAIYGNIVWGARTMAGADLLESGWKYVPVRRTADFIEQSLLQSLRWAVFEPNAAPLWASITLEVTGFMNALYGQGAFGGTTAAEAYQVVCDGTTTSPTDQLAGVVNVHVGFQPVEPAEFVVLTVQLNAGPAPAAS